MTFGNREPQAGNHYRQMPSHFLLFICGEQAKQFRLMSLQYCRVLPGGFFHSVGGPHANAGVRVPETLDEFDNPFRVSGDEFGDFIRSTYGSAISPGKHRPNCFPAGHNYNVRLCLPRRVTIELSSI